MNDHNRLESELAALRPHEPSPQLGQRIADELNSNAPAQARWRSSRAWWSGAMAGGLIAACLAAGLLLGPAPGRNQELAPPLAPLQLPVAVAFDDALPTVWTYNRALSRSARDFESVLDKHAAAASAAGGAAPHLFIQSDMQLLLQGEL